MNDASDSTPALGPNEEENLDKDVIGDSDEEINNEADGELDNIPSTVQPSEVPDDTEETFPLPHTSNEDSNLEESIEQPTIETTEETFEIGDQN